MTNTFSLGGELTVNRLGFGAMRLAMGTFGGPARAPETGVAVLRRALELGVNHIDTAGFYGMGPVRANDLIRTALAPYPADLVIATKVGPLRGADGRPSEQATADQLRGLVEADLRSLGLDRLDLVYLRVGGMGGPGGESIGERFEVLAGLREEGLIRHLGVSNVDAAQLAEARAVAPVAAVQNRYGGDLGLLEVCEGAGIAYVPYFPLGGGREPLEAGGTPARVRIASLLATSPVVLAIPGTGSLEHLEENMAAGGRKRSLTRPR
ncbi:aldo/keto reductase [Nonomuraea sp. PA05]|uniref:aldo/keto reductase n=1 Tax=Nonomuraea sp. PA05 TaxID=2604466 RepID=UPI0011D52EEF|nr:aldo/keto reductase [Nonomuraea sp. PA05]TYB51808.1 aldo/keto reductase [Nonomuraea sp. PA05]